MINLYKLEIFTVVVQAGSFSKAAERLYLTQSAVSQHIQDLESQLGAQIFHRGRRGVSLTVAGAVLLDYANAILKLLREAENAVTNVELLVGGQLKIGATPGADVYLMPDWVGSFQHRFPLLTVSLETNITSQIAADVMHHVIDLGVVEGELRAEEGLKQVELLEVNQVVIVGANHPWFNLNAISVEMLSGQPFIARLRQSHTRTWIENLLQPQKVNLNIIAEFANPEAIKRAVIAGMGISILPEYTVQPELKLGILHALTIQGLTLHRTIKLIWQHGEPFNPIARAFLTHLAAQFPQLYQILG